MARPEEQKSHVGAKSRSHQYREVFKPMMERKRRSRINRCLDFIKDLLQEVSHLVSGLTLTSDPWSSYSSQLVAK